MKGCPHHQKKSTSFFLHNSQRHVLSHIHRYLCLGFCPGLPQVFLPPVPTPHSLLINKFPEKSPCQLSVASHHQSPLPKIPPRPDLGLISSLTVSPAAEHPSHKPRTQPSRPPLLMSLLDITWRDPPAHSPSASPPPRPSLTTTPNYSSCSSNSCNTLALRTARFTFTLSLTFFKRTSCFLNE